MWAKPTESGHLCLSVQTVLVHKMSTGILWSWWALTIEHQARLGWLPYHQIKGGEGRGKAFLDTPNDITTMPCYHLKLILAACQYCNLHTERKKNSLAPSLSTTHCSPSDHFPIFTKLSMNPTPLPPPTLHSFCQLHSPQ